MSHSLKLATRTASIQTSAIREILKVVARPGMISLAGGIPSPESFPMDILNELNSSVIGKYGPAALQYDATEGFYPLREALSQNLSKTDIEADPEKIIVTSGSQGLLDCLGKILLDPGDVIAVESPTYLGALQAFNAYEPRYASIQNDDHGPDPDSLEHIFKISRPKFVYLVPNFQNPTGRTISLNRRKQIAELIKRYGSLIIEDDPYGALRYHGEPLPPFKNMIPDNVVYISTLSKVFAPGLRIGYGLAPEYLKKWLVIAKQGVDLHTSTYNQALAAEYLSGQYLEKHLPKIIELYRTRQKAIITALDEHFPMGMNWTRPEGGMFVWVQGTSEVNMDRVYDKCIQRKVAFVPGRHFYAEPEKGIETMRLNFTMFDAKTLNKAVQIIGEVLAGSC